jgi:hypothetical protein
MIIKGGWVRSPEEFKKIMKKEYKVMDKSKMKEIRKHVRETDTAYNKESLSNNKDYSPPTQEEIIAFNRKQAHAMHNEIQHRVREDVLTELWAANKVNHEGHWYIRLTDVVNIIGVDDE